MFIDDEVPYSTVFGKTKKRNKQTENPLLNVAAPIVEPVSEEHADIESNNDTNENQTVFWNRACNILPLLAFFNKNNDTASNQSSILNGCYNILTILGFCVLFSSPLLLFPQHNAILYPEYWYEAMISAALSFIITFSFDSLMVCKYYFKVDSMLTVGIFIRLFLSTTVSWILTCCVIYWIWTLSLGYKYPMPLTLVFGYIQFWVQYVTLYVLFKSNKHNIPNADVVEKRILPFAFSRLWSLCIDMQYKGLTFLFIIIPPALQWILAFLMPILRELNYFMVNQTMINWPKVEDGSGKQWIICGINAYHALYVAIKLGHTTTHASSVIILAVDFVLNLHCCYKVTCFNRAITPEICITDQAKYIAQREYLLVKFLLIEILEVLVPIAYVVTVLIAYYGPNAEILGNIRNDYWQYDDIDDIESSLQAVMIMCVIDGCSAIIGGYWIWRVSSIDCLEEACRVLRNYWGCIAVTIAHYLNYVRRNIYLLYIYPIWGGVVQFIVTTLKLIHINLIFI